MKKTTPTKTAKRLVVTQSKIRRLSSDLLDDVVGGMVCSPSCDPTEPKCGKTGTV